MDDKEFRERWEHLKQYESFYRTQSASDVLSILSYKWSQVSDEPDVGKAIWEGVGDASHAMTRLIMEHVPSQEQDRAFAALANLINYTFVISAHEKDRKEAKEYVRKVTGPAHQAARKKGIVSRDLTRRIAQEKRGPNGEALTPAQLVRHVKHARKEAKLPALCKEDEDTPDKEENVVRTIRRHLKGFAY
ncbi:hypothetical protein D3273_24610 [Lichenibacterium minor]|uniref:Uncharacterized protein n=1 Tax=Lichenibacterium minor TaxID=2316528 RepID=A0A4Q2U3H4_9HYPH|nr:hypothetical protein [Lichenibacterium minor]RYC29296.1 hypothetical protein D3273_24610 [Lichenibacterium minor]